MIITKVKPLSFIIVIASLLIGACKKTAEKTPTPPTTNNPTALYIGQNYQGGTIFYLLKPGDNGYDPNITHGLIVASLHMTHKWMSGTIFELIPNCSGTAIGTGKSNTEAAYQKSLAANVCYNLAHNGYSDWYLPSKNELEAFFSTSVSKDCFNDWPYITSSQRDDKTVYGDRYPGKAAIISLGFYSKNLYGRYVAVRSF